jgi:hypothetical protein
VKASAALNHEIGRSWNAGLGYLRDLQYVEGFSEPVLSDSVTVQTGGYLGPRVNVSAVGAYSRGSIGFSDTGNGIEGYSASVRGQLAVNRCVAAFVQYLASWYEFPEHFDAPLGLPNRSQRHGVRVGLTMWVPLLR